MFVDGDVRCYNSNSGIKNYGQLIITGELRLDAYTDQWWKSYYGSVTMSNKESSLIVGGNINLYASNCMKITNGNLILNGNQKQEISNLSTPFVILENESEEGVVFKTAISVSVLFNHKQNHFTLEKGGSFVDYDGDGLLDNVDLYPTIGNPSTLHFQSNNIEFGSVSIDEIETIGGTEITVTATPTFKYEFSKWINSSGTTLSTDAEYTFVAKSDQTITAVFIKRQQPITTQTENGKINVVSSAEIESEVAVTVTENAGYIFDEASLKYNGILIENNRFIMPDEPVLITAVFNRNDAYFALKDKIDEAAAIKYNDYSAESYANPTTALSAARSGLINHITVEEGQNLIAMLQSAIDGLETKYPVSISVKNTPVLYLGIDNLREQIVVTLTYDNNTTETLTDYEIDGSDCNILGDELLQISYAGITTELIVTVQKRRIADCNFSEIVDLPFEKDTNAKQDLVITNTNGDVLTEGTDYEVQYSDNDTPGLSSVEISGKGIYEGSVVKYFNIICSHQIETVEDSPATCTQDGRKVEGCSICGAATEVIREYNDLPESAHNYANNSNISYSINRPNATKYILHFSDSTNFESNDKLKIYGADDELIGSFTGTSLSGVDIKVNSNAVTLVLQTNGSGTRYGFSLDSVDVTYQIEKVTVFPATGHDYGDWISVDETVHQRVRANDPTHVETENHTWNSGTVTNAATCTGAGEKVYTCTVCSGTKTEAIPAINHAWGAWEKINDTQHQRVCENDPSHIETKNHSWDDGAISTPATCTDDGVVIFTCTVCGAEKTEQIPAIDHAWGEWEVTKEPTCTEPGEIVRICNNDNSHTEMQYILPLGHSDIDGDGVCDSCGNALDPDTVCPLCGKEHTGINGRIILFFHKLVLRLKQMFGAS